jgi:hypothetical protein
MRNLLAVVAAVLAGALITEPTAAADPGVRSPGTALIPDGPAQAWIVADMDSGQVLAGRDVVCSSTLPRRPHDAPSRLLDVRKRITGALSPVCCVRPGVVKDLA